MDTQIHTVGHEKKKVAKEKKEKNRCICNLFFPPRIKGECTCQSLTCVFGGGKFVLIEMILV